MEIFFSIFNGLRFSTKLTSVVTYHDVAELQKVMKKGTQALSGSTA
jgi:hypothetical protein